MEKKFSVKEFFKSTAFKCIYVLLAIVLVCGVLLAFCNDLFEVTAEEKLNRTLSKIYGQSVEAEDALKDGMTLEFDNGEINSAYLVKDDGNYLVNASGTGGYYGSVACWIVVEISDNSLSGIRSVIVDKADNASEFTNRISEDNLEYFADSFDGEEEFTVSDWQGDSLHGGATPQLTMTAIVNAVNTALEFVRTQLLGEVIVPDEPSPFEKFSYYSETYISDDTTVELAEDGTSVVFGIVANPYVFTSTFRMSITVDNTGTITAMTVPATPADGNGSTDGFENSMDENVLNASLYIGKTADEILDYLGGEPKDDFTYEDLKNNAVADNTITSGATYSNFIVTYAALFAASNYQNGYVMALENSVQYTQYIDMENTTVELAEDGTSVIFSIVAKPYVFTSTFHISITVDNTGTITSMTVPATPADGNGSTEGFESSMDENVLNASLYIGKTADEILAYLGGEPKDDFTYEDLKNNAVADNTITSGATYSNFIVTYSALFAASNYEVYAELIPLKLNQQMSEIYGGSVVVEAVSLDGLTATVGKGTVNTVYSVAGTDDYIVSATGNGGYENGTVTCWIVVETENGAVSGIGNVVIAGNEKQSFISYISDENLAHFGESFDGSDFELADWKNNNLTGGASMSTTAIINSVNIAKNFVSANLISGGENA